MLMVYNHIQGVNFSQGEEMKEETNKEINDEIIKFNNFLLLYKEAKESAIPENVMLTTARFFTRFTLCPPFYNIFINMKCLEILALNLYIPGGTEDKTQLDASLFRKINICSNKCQAFFDRNDYNPVCPICDSSKMFSGVYLATMIYPRYCLYRSLFFSNVSYWMKHDTIKERSKFHDFFKTALFKKIIKDGTINLKDGAVHLFGDIQLDSENSSIKLIFYNIPQIFRSTYEFTIIKFPKGKYCQTDKYFDIKKAYSCAIYYKPDQLVQKTKVPLAELKDVLYEPLLDYLTKLSQVGFYAIIPFPSRRNKKKELVKIHCVTIYEYPRRLYNMLGQIGKTP